VSTSAPVACGGSDASHFHEPSLRFGAGCDRGVMGDDQRKRWMYATLQKANVLSGEHRLLCGTAQSTLTASMVD